MSDNQTTEKIENTHYTLVDLEAAKADLQRLDERCADYQTAP